MKAEYDFTDAIKNPYAHTRKNTVTIRLDAATIDYFKKLAGDVSLPYLTLINAYLTDCARRKLKPDLTWK